MLKSTLSRHGYKSNSTLVGTAVCCDEVTKPLIADLEREFGRTFSMGGLAGFAFGGVTSFGAMATHIPDNGNCIVVYGPHVGVDSEGRIGTVNRRGRKCGGSCCGSATAAAGFVASRRQANQKDIDGDFAMNDPLDAQQQFVNKLLLPFGERLDDAADKDVELPLALFDAQHDLMQRIVSQGCNKVGRDGKIALVGGININTPDGMTDYFLPLRFELRDSQGALLEDFLYEKRAIEVNLLILLFVNIF
jgi:hypothetical protein